MSCPSKAFVALLCLGVVGTLHAAPKHGNFASESVTAADTKRVYRLVVPTTVDLKKPAPLVIAFHGILVDSKDVMPIYTGLNDAAKKHKFILAYPNAIDRSWGIDPAKVKKDIALFDALVAKLSKEYKVDSKRIYVLGMSNGGYFAHLIGKERSRKIAAVASHSGPLGLQTLFGVNAARKFPVMIIHGDKDGLFPISVARENRDKYKREGHKVKYVEVAGLGHIWATKSGINDEIWKFFAAHPLK